MKRLLFIIFWIVLTAVLTLTLSMASAQEDSTPQITSFTADLDSVTPDEAESGEKTVTLSWETENLTANYRLNLQVFVLGAWSDSATGLSASGSISLTVPHTLDFQPPTWRLLVLSSTNQILDEHILTIPYAVAAGAEVNIAEFSATTQTVNINDLVRRSARITVNWVITNRLPDSNLRFLQVLPNESTVSVELPRIFDWIRSTGSGVVAPLQPNNAQVVNLRLEVYNIQDDTVYESQDISLSIIGTLNQPVTQSTVQNTSPPTLATTTVSSPAECSPAFFFVEAGREYAYSGGGILNGNLFTLCPATADGTTQALYQMFENGFMIYRADTNVVTIFSNNGFAATFPNTYVEGETLNFANTPSNGLLVPQGILGKAYLEHYDVAQFLGWGLAPEESYILTYQETYQALFSWNGGIVMTFPFGGRFFLTLSEWGGTPPVWAYINATN